ncbi:MAG: ABC transporter ATP-binding protein [Pseudomonas sp.]
MALLEISNLHLQLASFDGRAQVLQGVSLSLERGQILGLVGETGCGKSVTGLSVSRLLQSPPAHYTAGEILFEGRDLLKLNEAQMRPLRGRRIGMVFQDPTTNLNPAFRISTQMIDVALALGIHSPDILEVPPNASKGVRRAAARALAIQWLDRVGISEAARRIDLYPHEFSGGMRQRVLIAMAMMGRPDVLIADEPTTALDVLVQAQIMKLMHELVTDYQIGILLITHNLGLVAQLCTHVAVMYAGQVAETGEVAPVFAQPRHPYTHALLAAVPSRNSVRGALQSLAGTVPQLFTPPPGCRFADRCSRAIDICRTQAPVLSSTTTAANRTHLVACYSPVPQPGPETTAQIGGTYA